MTSPTTLPTQYEATRNRDGTWNILDVPVFGEIPAKSDNGRPLITREWLEAAVEKDRARRAEGYTAPLHIHHHEGQARKPERAGELCLRDVRQARYDGAEVGVVFADLEKVPDTVYQRIKRGTLPYRSVEILDMDANEISSCALLDSEVPFFRFPNLTVSVERPNLRFSAPKRLTRSPVEAWIKSGRTRGFLFNALGVTMIEDVDGNEEVIEALEVETPEVEAPSDEAVESAAERMFSLITSLSEKFAALEEKVDEISQMSEPDITPPSPVEGDELNETPDGGTSNAPEVATFNAEAASLQGRLLALEQKLAADEAEKATNARFSAALVALDGFNLTEKTKSSLKHFAALGQDHLDTVVATFQETLTKFPAPTIEDATSGPATADPDEVAAYSADANKHARARALAAQYESLKAHMSCSLAEFIKTNIDRRPTASATAE